MPKLTDSELIAAIEAEESVALDAHSGQLRAERADAWARYKGDPLGNEVEGRSQIVDKGVLDTIQWIVPSLVRIYLGGDDVGQFEPMGPEDEYAAQCETEVCNWYLQSKNDFYSHIVATLTDALLLKNGYIAGNWTVREDVLTERYKGLADEEFAMLLQDQDVEITEHTAYPDPLFSEPSAGPEGMVEAAQPVASPRGGGMPPVPMLHDCTLERKKADEFVAVESIPPDEMLVSRRHRWTSLADADFVQWRRRASIGQLRAEGFKVPDDSTEYNDLGVERTFRERFDQDRTFSDETPDPARKIVLFKDTYIRIDLSNSGRPKLWRVAYVDGMDEPCLKEEADCIPVAAFSPIIYPHSHVGTSVYDLINDLSLIKTMMQRQLVDGTYLQTSGRMAVDVNTVNVDDLLVTRPGGIVRVEGDPGNGLMPITTPDVGPTVMASLEYLDNISSTRTGVTRAPAGLDPNTLNKTATGVQQMQASANQRIELIARTLAGGFRDLFLIIHTLAAKHSTKPVQMKLKGNWQAIDPRSWAKRTDFKINVGLGTGTPAEQAQKLLMMAPSMQQAVVMGLAGPQEVFNYIDEQWKALGYKTANKFIHEPEKDPQTGKPKMPQPPPDPAVQVAQIKAQSDQQSLQAKAQTDAQKFQAEQAANQQKIQLDAQAKQQEQQNALALQASNDQRDAQKSQLDHEFKLQQLAVETQLKREEMALQAQLKREEMQAHAEVQMRTAEMASQTQLHTAERSAQSTERVAESKRPPEPKRPKAYNVVRGPDGRAARLEVVH